MFGSLPKLPGSVPLYVPPFSYKRGGMQRYNTGGDRLKDLDSGPLTHKDT
jgi:hypothetical protein